MKRFTPALLAMITCLTSCQAIGAIFKAGMWWGIILVVIVIFVVLWLLNKAGGSKRD